MPRPVPSHEELIKRFRSKHGMRYLYSKVIYQGAHKKVEIICRKKEHGSFFQTPAHHAIGTKCPKCAIQENTISQTSNTRIFVKRAKSIHQKKYKYHLTKYVTARKKVTIFCPIHKEFLQTPSKHLQGQGCNLCGIASMVLKQSMDKKEFISRAKVVHQNLYSYKNTSYESFHKKVLIICKNHGEYYQTPATHLGGGGCKKCAVASLSNLRRRSKDEIIQKFNEVHENFYDYSKIEYRNYHSKVEIICPIHSSFLASSANHIAGKGCPKCFIKTEGRIASFLKTKMVIWRQFNIQNKYYDFLLPQFNLIIERDGEQHYREISLFSRNIKDYLKRQRANDKLKTKLAKEAGFKIARMPYWLTKQEEEIEIENILAGKPTYPDVPDLKQENTRPKPTKNF